eukprot:1173379-Lingulodinium_polyedra.AAC.1
MGVPHYGGHAAERGRDRAAQADGRLGRRLFGGRSARPLTRAAAGPANMAGPGPRTPLPSAT